MVHLILILLSLLVAGVRSLWTSARQAFPLCLQRSSSDPPRGGQFCQQYIRPVYLKRNVALFAGTSVEDFVPERNEELSLLKILSPPASCDVDQMSVTDLAYIGDCVYELMVRSHTVWPPKRTTDLQNKVVSLVRAEHQAVLVRKLRDNESIQLSPKEVQVLNRGRNGASSRNNRRGDPAAYQDATALEALIGYLHVTDQARCAEVLRWVQSEL